MQSFEQIGWQIARFPLLVIALAVVVLNSHGVQQLVAQEANTLANTMTDTDRRELLGRWTFELTTPGGPLACELELGNRNGAWQAAWINGPERIPVDVVNDGGRMVLDMPHYDSKIEMQQALPADRAANTGGTVAWAGTWTKRRGASEVAQLACTMKPAEATDWLPPEQFLGRWSVQFADSQDPAIGVFERFEGTERIVGTFLTTTGDYRYLFGGVESGQLRLSCFDGAHAFLFTAKIDEAGTLRGSFWSGDWYNDTWTGKLDPLAELPDGFTQTLLSGAKRLGDLSFPDVQGQPQSLGDAKLLGKVTLVEVFGTWCPNCHDEAAYLKTLREKYADQGLKVVGLAFELTGDLERDTTQVQRYVQRFKVDYPVLVAGLSDKAEASKAFPVLDRIRSYPTTMFLDQTGTIRAVYTGFSGPATGDDYERLQSRWEKLIEQLLRE